MIRRVYHHSWLAIKQSKHLLNILITKNAMGKMIMLSQSKIIQQKIELERSIKVIDNPLQDNLKVKSSIDTKIATIFNIADEEKLSIVNTANDIIKKMKLQFYILNELKNDLDKLLAFNSLQDEEQEMIMILKLREKIKILQEYNAR